MKYLLTVTALLLSINCFGQESSSTGFYKKRADLFFDKVWSRYRLEKHLGLFGEYYPRGEKIDLNYFQGADVSSREISFLWPFSGIFSATNVLIRHPDLKKKYARYLDSLTVGIWAYRDTSRRPTGYQAFPAALEKSDRYYDDNALVCIDFCEGYLNTKDSLYIVRARETFGFIISGWDETLGGGVYWLEGHRDQKPACSNGMATLAALKLYRATGEATYLDWGKRFYAWTRFRLRNPQGIYYNDVKMDGRPNKTYYTYNTGSMLEASVLLYDMTGDRKYLSEARLVAKNAFSFFSEKSNGETHLKIDLPWFVTVLFRGYEALYRVDHNPVYINAIALTLDRAWEESSDQLGFLTAKWATDEASRKRPKWLLDEACIAELYGRLSLLDIKQK